MGEQLLLDGGMGAALMAGGLDLPALPEEWLLSRPEAVAAVHAAHARAGADLLLTCTFNLASPRLEARGLAGGDELAGAAVRLLRGAAPGCRVAGALGPTGLAGPGAGTSEQRLQERYRVAFAALAAAGADLLWAESQVDLGEACLALRAGRSCGLEVAVTLGPLQDAGRLHLPGGPPLDEALRVLWREGASAVGLNCVLPGADLAGPVSRLAGTIDIPLVVKPSAGLPGSIAAPEAWAAWVVGAVRAGAGWAGGCCGAGPSHLAALRQALRGTT